MNETIFAMRKVQATSINPVQPICPMNSTRSLRLAAALAALALAGCVSPDTRIQSDPAAFARLSPDQQALVRAGRIAVGFDMDAVKLAMGNPDRVTLRTTASGQTQIWHYVTYDYSDDIFWGGYGGGFGGYYGGGWGRGRGFYGPGWGWGFGYPFGYDGIPHDRLRVTFSNGLVSSFQEERP